MQLHGANIPKIFIGVDIHKLTWSVTIQTDIFFHKTFSIPSDPEILYQYVESHFPDHEVSMVYEAGCCGFHAARYFLNLGWEVLVVNPADVKLSDKDRYLKTDAIDSKKLSDQLKKGDLKGIYIPSEAHEQLTGLARHRSQLTRQLRKSKVQIKSMLLYHGIKIPEQYDNNYWTHAFLDWLDNIDLGHIPGDLSLKGKIRVYRFIKLEYQQTANQLRAYCRKHHKKDYELLKSIPGIGGFLAAVIIAECGDVRRFNNEKQFASFIGLVPGICRSGLSEKSLGLTHRGRHQLRSYLVEAAWIAVRKDPEMQAYYRKHYGKNVKNIIIKVAHKMARRILSVIKTETPYQANYSLIAE
jgi:transposase